MPSFVLFVSPWALDFRDRGHDLVKSVKGRELSSELPLAGIKVLDATSNIAGPWGGTVLGDLGADVLKIETPNGDPSRFMAPVDADRSAYFHVVNRNKDVITIDLKTEDGKAKLHELFDDCDVFLTNFLPAQLEKFGLTSLELRKLYPQLIIGNLSSYGSQGPSSSWPGYDATLQARTGVMSVTGERDGPPVRAGVSILDLGAGTWLALGILAAIVKRDRTGQGSLVETSLYGYHIAAYELTGHASVRSGSGHPAFSPYGIFATKQGDICIGVGNNAIFAKLCHKINRPELISDSQFHENADRVENASSLKVEIEKGLIAHPATYWVKILCESGVAAEEVRQPEELLTDEQAKSMGILIDYPDTSTDVKVVPGLPLRFDGKRPQVRKPAPRRV
jgi:crotonobetainyl-CoA:carnitine CoA-transferase CaiB-like acyl-CoA transferase